MPNDALLTQKEVGNPGCGCDTDNACFALSIALSIGAGGWQCLMIANKQAAQWAGIKLGWRVNVDADGKAWCPKGQLNTIQSGYRCNPGEH